MILDILDFCKLYPEMGIIKGVGMVKQKNLISWPHFFPDSYHIWAINRSM